MHYKASFACLAFFQWMNHRQQKCIYTSSLPHIFRYKYITVLTTYSRLSWSSHLHFICLFSWWRQHMYSVESHSLCRKKQTNKQPKNNRKLYITSWAEGKVSPFRHRFVFLISARGAAAGAPARKHIWKSISVNLKKKEKICPPDLCYTWNTLNAAGSFKGRCCFSCRCHIDTLKPKCWTR